MQIPQRPALYARISLDRSGEQVGVRDQIEQGKKHLSRIGWGVPEVYVDNDISAASGVTRPDFERLLVDLADGTVDGLSARHLDRLLRRLTDLERLLDALEARRTPVPVTFTEGSDLDLSSANGRMLARILASVAAQESEMKSERVSGARRREAAAGKAHGHLGYGYDAAQNIILSEAAVIREAADRLIAGDSLYSIARDLNEREIPTAAGHLWSARRVQTVMSRGTRTDLIKLIEVARSPAAVTPAEAARLLRTNGATITAEQVRQHEWHEHLAADDHGLDDSTIAVMLTDAGVTPDRSLWRAANLRAMLRRGSLAGWREHSPGARGGGGELIAKGDWPAILSRETVEEIRRITNRPGVRGQGRPPKYLLAGILKCGLCGAPMGGGPSSSGVHRYSCTRPLAAENRCTGMTVVGPPVDEMVTLAVIDVLADADIRAGRRRRSATPEGVSEAEREIADVERLRAEYAQEAASGGLTPAEWRTVREGLDARAKAANRVLSSWRPSLKVVLGEVPQDRDEVTAWWDAASMERRREVVKELIDGVTVDPSTRAGNRFDPDRVRDPEWRV